MAKRTKQLQDEISAAIEKGSPHPEATVTDWKKRIADIQRRSRTTHDPEQRALLKRQLEAASDGFRAAQSLAASKPTYVTGTNLFALKETILAHGGPEFSSRVPAVDVTHLKRTVAAGLVEVVGNKARLTADGRVAVADAIVKDIDRESSWQPQVNTFVEDPDKRAEFLARDIAEHKAKIARLEIVLAKLAPNRYR